MFTNLIKWGFTALWWNAEVLHPQPLALYWCTLKYTYQTHSEARSTAANTNLFHQWKLM